MFAVQYLQSVCGADHKMAGRDPLWWAEGPGMIGVDVVRCLHERNPDIEKNLVSTNFCNYRWAPLDGAVKEGHDGVGAIWLI